MLLLKHVLSVQLLIQLDGDLSLCVLFMNISVKEFTANRIFWFIVEIPRPEIQVCGRRWTRGLFYPVCVVFGMSVFRAVLESSKHQAVCCRQWLPLGLLIVLRTGDFWNIFMVVISDITMSICAWQCFYEILWPYSSWSSYLCCHGHSH